MTKANFYLSQYFDTKDTKYLENLAQMIENDEIRLKANTSLFKEPTLLFKEASIFENNCSRCEEPILKGLPIFWFGKDYWHMECATEKEREEQTYFKEICKKALAGDKRYATINLILQQEKIKENEQKEAEATNFEEFPDINDLDDQEKY